MKTDRTKEGQYLSELEKEDRVYVLDEQIAVVANPEQAPVLVDRQTGLITPLDPTLNEHI